MESIKSFLLLVVVILFAGITGYWAFTTLEPGNVSAERQKREELEQKNLELEKKVTELASELATLKPAENTDEIPNTNTEELAPVSYKYQELISKLDGLVKDKVSMKEKAKGARVGIIQEFFNLYNKTSQKIDNDYGKSTKADVTNFQKTEGSPSYCEAGISTFEKMIEWLKEQG